MSDATGCGAISRPDDVDRMDPPFEVESLPEAAAGDWHDKFREAARLSEGIVGDVDRFLARWSTAFGAGFRETFSPDEALLDIIAIDELTADGPLCVRVYRKHADPAGRFRFKLYNPHVAAPLADVIVVLDELGLTVLAEEGFEIRPSSPEAVIWAHEFLVEGPFDEALRLSSLARPFERAFCAIWTGRAERDSFSRLLLDRLF